MNLLRCEAHHELQKTNYKTVINGEAKLSHLRAVKAAELQKMPV